ncbi:MAG: bifunctional alpha,alpha-trehalose-phosphate synthase (UDP-forming)/trehalose-phosphatase [Flavobacterium sp.]|nr:bifunctional alpha,alpha-trehalose-phosphate synthase (UDP-forming)/trehalose-phosphatase [Flavobacterium sp.]
MSKTIIVANRLPLDVKITDSELTVKPSVGGLATGLKSVHESGDTLWIGWSGVTNESLTGDLTEQVNKIVSDAKCQNILLTEDEVEKFYFGFSNNALWPLFHYFLQYAKFEVEEWEAYKSVNQKFADAVIEQIREGDRIWIHDYQLLLVPKMIRDKRPDALIGFFLHIPYPSYEIFRTFPWREELLEGMLGANLIGFHTYDYERHFLSSCKRILSLEVKFNDVVFNDRIVKIDSFPMGIDYEKFHNAAFKHMQNQADDQSEFQQKLSMHFNASSGTKMILSIDRLDYTKGIPNRLLAFEYFLDKYPQFIEKVRLIMLAVPSRLNVPQYQKLKRETDELVGRINGRFSSVSWTPIWYFYRAVPFEDLIDLYASSHVALINPIRDGMNLVAKEYVATRVNKDGVIILSEMAGAAKEMTEALLINPSNYDQIADSLKQALEMPLDEQKTRMEILQNRLRPYSVDKWASEFLQALDTTKNARLIVQAKAIEPKLHKAMLSKFKKSQKRLFLLDYDGTLVGFKNNPKDASPDAELYALLDSLNSLPNTEVAIISGRDHEIMQKWFGDRDYSLITDHGVWLRRKGEEWEKIEHLKNDWKENLRPILEKYVDRTPGTFIEEKEYSLAWHYRRADPELANLRTMELTTVLTSLIANNGLSVLEGSKVIEIKSSSVSKGRAATRLMTGTKYDFVMAIGDDWTDEHMFEELPRRAITIKVGFKKTVARFYIKRTDEVRTFLKSFS